LKNFFWRGLCGDNIVFRLIFSSSARVVTVGVSDGGGGRGQATK